MLKKFTYVAITSGLFLAPLGASAMVSDSPFPPCIGSDCAIVAGDDAQRVSTVVRGESANEATSRTNRAEVRERTGDSPFPVDNSKD